jgi:hypothetical protein
MKTHISLLAAAPMALAASLAKRAAAPAAPMALMALVAAAAPLADQSQTPEGVDAKRQELAKKEQELAEAKERLAKWDEQWDGQMRREMQEIDKAIGKAKTERQMNEAGERLDRWKRKAQERQELVQLNNRLIAEIKGAKEALKAQEEAQRAQEQAAPQEAKEPPASQTVTLRPHFTEQSKRIVVPGGQHYADVSPEIREGMIAINARGGILMHVNADSGEYAWGMDSDLWAQLAPDHRGSVGYKPQYFSGGAAMVWKGPRDNSDPSQVIVYPNGAYRELLGPDKTVDSSDFNEGYALVRWGGLIAKTTRCPS